MDTITLRAELKTIMNRKPDLNAYIIHKEYGALDRVEYVLAGWGEEDNAFHMVFKRLLTPLLDNPEAVRTLDLIRALEGVKKKYIIYDIVDDGTVVQKASSETKLTYVMFKFSGCIKISTNELNTETEYKTDFDYRSGESQIGMICSQLNYSVLTEGKLKQLKNSITDDEIMECADYLAYILVHHKDLEVEKIPKLIRMYNEMTPNPVSLDKRYFIPWFEDRFSFMIHI